MNKIFKVIWNQATQSFVVVSELTKLRSKQTSSTRQRIKPNKLFLSMGMAGALLISESALAVTATTAPYLATDQWGRIALGTNSNALGSNSPLAIGSNSNSNGESAISIGRNSSSTGTKSIALGRDSYASSDETTAIGSNSYVNGIGSVALGTKANTTTSRFSMAMGASAETTADNSIAIGARSKTEDVFSTTIGVGAHAIAKKTVVIGGNAQGIRIRGENDDAVKNPHLVVIGSDALVRNVEKEQSRGSTVIGGNALAGFLTNSTATIGNITNTANGTQQTEDYLVLANTDYDTATGDLTTPRLMYRAGILDANGNKIVGTDVKGNIISFRSNEATAIGFDSRAIGDQSIAIGAQVIAGHASVAIGGNDMISVLTKDNLATYNNIVGTELASNTLTPVGSSKEFYETTYAKDGSVAIGQKSHANDLFSTAIGTASFVQAGANLGTAIGAGARVGNQTNQAGTTLGSNSIKSTKGGVAIAAGAVAEGDYTTAVGTGANALENNATAVGYKAFANQTGSLAFGANARSQADDAVAIGTNANVTGISSIAFGTNTNVTGTHSVALGSNITSLSTNGSVVLGDSSTEILTDANGNLIKNLTLNGEAVGGASHAVGTVKTATVRTIGDSTFTYSGFAGQPKDAGKYVSIGAVGAERQLKNVAAGNIDEKSTDAINGSQLYAVAVKAASPLIFTANKNLDTANTTRQYEAGNGLERELGETLSIAGAKDSVATSRNEDAAVSGNYSAKNIQTIVDNNGVQIQMAENPEFDTVKVGSKTDAEGNSVPVVELSTDKGVPTTSEDKEGNKTTTNAPTALSVKDSEGNNSQINGIASALGTKEVGTSPNGGDGTPTSSDTLVDLTPPTDPKDAAKWESSAVTVGDIAKMGWIVQAEGNNYTDTVKNANKVNFKGEGAVTVTGKTDDDGVRNITVKVDTDSIKNEITGTSKINDDGTANSTTDGDKNKVATVGDIVDTINKVSWKTNSTTATGGANLTKVNAGDAVNFEAGKNMQVTQKVETVNGKDTISYTYSTKDEVEFDKVTAKKGLTLGEGDNAVNMTPTNTTVADDNIAPAVNMNGATLTNITSNLPNTTSVENAPTNTAPITAQDAADLAKKSGSNAATLNDVLNAGWNLQENGNARDFVKPYDTVNFVNGTGTIANITSDGSVSNVTYHVAVDDKTTEITYTNKAGDTLYKQTDGSYNTKADGSGTMVNAGDVTGSRVSAKTSPITVNNATGQVNTPANPTALATAGDVATAINHSGWNATVDKTGNGESVDKGGDKRVNPGDTVKFTAGDNMHITKEGLNYTIATKKDVQFNSVKAGPVTINNNGIDAGNTKITNVAKGTAPNDAVNVSQLKEATGDINNKIERNTKDLRAGLAGARAAAGLPQVYLPGKSMVAVSAGAYQDQSAIAVGYSRASDNGKLILKLQGDTNSRGEVGGSVGVGYQW